MAKTTKDLGFLSGQQGNVEEQVGFKYQVIQWLNGRKSLASLGKDNPMYTGGFFFKQKQDEDFPVGEEMVYTFNNGDEEDVKALGGADIVVLASRLHWFVQDSGGGRTWLKTYRKGAKGRNQFLVVVRGAEDWHQRNGPLLLSMYGVNGLMMARVYQDFRDRVHKVAEDLSARSGGPARLDAYTFYMPVRPDKHQKASPQFETLITPPRLDLDGFDKDQPVPFLNKIAVPKDYRDENGFLTALWDEAQEWAREEPFGEYEDEFTRPADAGNDDSGDKEFDIGDLAE